MPRLSRLAVRVDERPASGRRTRVGGGSLGRARRLCIDAGLARIVAAPGVAVGTAVV